MVTINPAKILGIDHLTGSIKTGKDADLVLWNTDPLSIYAKAEMTMIEGTVYFDKQTDENLREYASEERQRIINKILDQK
jgi:imidazolonepropionase-like amidohydrolase